MWLQVSNEEGGAGNTVREMVAQGWGVLIAASFFFFLRNYLFCGGGFLFVLFSCIARHERS